MKSNKLIIIFVFILFIFSLSLAFFYPVFSESYFWVKPSGLYGGEIFDIAFSPNFSKDNLIFAVGPEGIYVSKDKGLKWERKTFTFAEGAYAVLFSPNFQNDSTVFLGTKTGIYATKDLGSSWFVYQRGLVNNYITEIQADEKENVFALSFDGVLMEKYSSDDLWRTLGFFRDPLATTFTVSNGAAFVGCEQGVLYKLDITTKESVKIVENLTEGAISDIEVRNGVIYLSTYDNGIFISKDQKTFSNELQGEKIASLEITDDGKIIALASYGGVHVRDSSGWKQYPLPLKSTNISIKASPDFSSSGLVFIASYEYGIFKSTDSGRIFSISNTGITNLDIADIAFSKNYTANRRVYVTSQSGGLYISNDGGNSFISFGNLPRDILLRCVEELSNGTITVGSAGEGIFVSKNGGDSFERLSILNNNVISFIKELDNKTILIGTKDTGIYSSDLNFENFKRITSGFKAWDINFTAVSFVKNVVLAGTNGGDLFISSDFGTNFTEISNNAFSGMAITGVALSPNFAVDKTILVGTAYNAYKSTVGGNQFLPLYDLTGVWADGCAISPNFERDRFMVVGAWSHVYISKDIGMLFNDIYSNIDNRYIIKVALSPDFEYAKSGSIFILTNSGGLFIYKQTPKTVVKMTIDKKGMFVNGKYVDTDAPPVIMNSRTLVPVRFVSEALGAQVQWFDKEKKVLITRKNTEIALFINNTKAFVNGKEIMIDSQNPKVTPIIISGRTYVPIRFISEAFGAVVEWDPDLRQVIVTLEG